MFIFSNQNHTSYNNKGILNKVVNLKGDCSLIVIFETIPFLSNTKSTNLFVSSNLVYWIAFSTKSTLYIY